MKPTRRLSLILLAAAALIATAAPLGIWVVVWSEWPNGMVAGIGASVWAAAGIGGLGFAAGITWERTRFADRVEAILRPVHDAVLITDSSDCMVISNAAAQALDLTAARTAREPSPRLIPDPDLQNLVVETRIDAGATPLRRIEHRMTRDGRRMLYEVTLAHLPAMRGVATVLRDITAHGRLSEAKSDFTAAVSHELRTPLSSIKAYTEMLLDDEVPDETTRSEFYQIIQSETDRLSRLIDNILSISRIESGLTPEPADSVCLIALCHQAEELVRPGAREKGVRLEVQPCAGVCRGVVDEKLILETMVNLIRNAVQHTTRGGGVVIKPFTDTVSETIGVRVSDTGSGISAEALPRLFDKFYRAPESRQNTQGAGLGLTLVKRVVEVVHEGTVMVQSGIGGGSTFGFSIPACRRRPPLRLSIHEAEESYA